MSKYPYFVNIDIKRISLIRSNEVIGIFPTDIITELFIFENDFVVINQQHTTHVLNAISPAWSASFAFAEHLIVILPANALY